MKKTKSVFGGVPIGFNLLGRGQFLLWGSFLVLILVGCPSSVDEMGEILKNGGGEGYSVSGTISVSNSGGSPEGAVVQLESDSVEWSASTTADENGAYTISGVYAGNYSIKVTLAGYNPITIGTFEVSADVSDKDIQLTAITASGTAYTISGTVSVNGDDSPAGARVQLRQDGSPVGQAASAGSDGAYTISGAAEGTYAIEVSLDGYNTGTIGEFEVSANVSDKDIQLTAVTASGTTYTISGTVSVNDSGSPAGAQVQLRQDGSPVGSVASADSNGAYTISGAAAGTYTIEVSLDGYTTGTIDPFTVSGNVSGKNIQLAKTSSGSENGGDEPGTSGPYYVSGTITIDDKVPPTPAVGAQVILRKSGEVATFGQAITDSNGAYKIDLTGITPGYWVAKVSMSGWSTSETPEFNVTDTKDITKVNLRIWPSSYTLSGTVTTDIPGGAASGATVILVNKSGGQVASTTTNSSGNYTFSVATGDGYSLKVTLAGYKTLTTYSDIGISTANVVRNLALEASRYDVSGRISTNLGDNTRANGAKVELKQNGSVVKTEHTVDTGDYEFEDVLTGTYTIDVSFAGFISASIPSFAVSGNVEDKDLTLIQQTQFSVSGTVSLSDGGNASGASVQLRQSGGAAVGSAVPAGSGGAYTIANVANGTYKVEASLAGYNSGVTSEFTVSGGNVTGKNLTLQKESAMLAAITGKTLAAAFDSVKAQASGTYLIELGQDETNVADYALTGFNTPVTITVDGKGRTVNWASGTSTTAGCLTLSQADVTLVLKNVTFTGPNTTAKTQSLVRIKSGATLQMENGVTLTDNYVASGGGVYIDDGGNFTMTGGSITGNKFSSSGGGVFIGIGGTMTMTGGSVVGNTHKTNGDDGTNDVRVHAGSAGSGTLIMSGNARIGRIHLYDQSRIIFGAITINSSFTGADTVAIIDVTSVGASYYKDLQILNGTAVSSVYNRFVLGAARSSFSSGTGTDISGSGYFIDSGGYLRVQ
jgi:hypothetical protein